MFTFILQYVKILTNLSKRGIGIMTDHNSRIKDENTDFLLNCILSLKDIDECYAFFGDLCTVPEIKSMARRIVVAKMLTEDKKYEDIVEKTGASTATISRVNRSLCYGNDGYTKVFQRIRESEEE